MQTAISTTSAPCRWRKLTAFALRTRWRAGACAPVLTVRSDTGGALEPDGEEDDRRLERERPRVRHEQHVEARRDHLHDQRADDRTGDRRPAARQRSATDHGRRD